MTPDDLPPKIASKTAVNYSTGCWEWTGAKRPDGYGNIHSPTLKRPIRAHRVVYELLVGPIPPGLTLDHLCRVRHCVNPSHLEPVTRGENVLRGEGPAARHARQTHCIHGHEFTTENTRSKTGGGRACRACQRARDEGRCRDKTISTYYLR